MRFRFTILTGFLCLLTGCFGPPDLPTELEVVLPNDVRQTAQVNSGATALADSSWAAFRKADPAESETTEDSTPPPGPYGGLLNGGFLARLEPDTLMFRGHFAEGGRATRVADNAFYLPEIFGVELDIDGQFHATRIPFLSFAAASFGATAGDQLGMAIAAEVRFFGISLGTAVVYSWGTMVDDRIDGTFGYRANLNGLADLLLGSGGDQYPFYMLRDP